MPRLHTAGKSSIPIFVIAEPPPAQGGTQRLGEAEAVRFWTPVVDVPVNMQLKFQQFCEFDIPVPQIQFIVRVLDISVVPQRQVQCSTVHGPVVVQRQVPGMVLTVLITVEVPQSQFIDVAANISVAAQRHLPVWVFTVPAVLGEHILCRKHIFWLGRGRLLTSGMSPR